MVFKILIRYILGYVNISIQGYYIERFINLCISNGIFLWNVKLKEMAFASANVGIQDFKKLKIYAKKTGCRIKLESKRGLPFLMDRYKKRKIFFGVLILMALLFFAESRFIWNIEIRGIERINEEEIMQNLEEYGLKVRKTKIKCRF